MNVIAHRLMVAFVCAAFVTSVAYYCSLARPDLITLGSIASRTGNHSSRKVIVSNLAGPKQYGRYLVFETTDPTSYPVVIRLASSYPFPANRLVLTGHCRGVCQETIADCPCPAPFVLIDAMNDALRANEPQG